MNGLKVLKQKLKYIKEFNRTFVNDMESIVIEDMDDLSIDSILKLYKGLNKSYSYILKQSTEKLETVLGE